MSALQTDDGADRSSAAGDDPLGAGVEQFQRAALEAVHAARAMLDAAEAVLREPAAIEAVVNTVSAVARTATESVAGFAAEAVRRAEQATGSTSDRPAGTGTDAAGDDDTDGFERITVD